VAMPMFSPGAMNTMFTPTLPSVAPPTESFPPAPTTGVPQPQQQWSGQPASDESPRAKRREPAHWAASRKALVMMDPRSAEIDDTVTVVDRLKMIRSGEAKRASPKSTKVLMKRE